MPDDPQVSEPRVEEPVATVPPASRARGSLPTSTVVVGALLILVVGFGAGLFAGRLHRGDRFDGSIMERHLQGGTGMPQGDPGGIGFGAAGGAGLGSTAVAGTVTGIDGDALTIQTLRGETITVHVSSATQVRVSQTADLGDLSTGATVVVLGQPDGAGGFNAIRVIEGAMAASG